jgi:hypothetical protein
MRTRIRNVFYMIKKIIWILILLTGMHAAIAQHKPTHSKKIIKHTHKHKSIAHKKTKHPVKKKPVQTTEISHEMVEALNENAGVEIAKPEKSFWPHFNLVSSIEHRLVQFVHKTVDGVRYTSYKLGGRKFDASRGIYVLDCSDYVDNVLEAVNPRAYWSLADTMGSDKPTTQHYYEFFSGLSEYPSYYWNKIDDVEKLEPGDILVFRKSNATHRRIGGGHVMVVMNKPVFDEDAYLVRVADSAPSGHSQDTRQPHRSGIGIGTILLKVNPRTGKPNAYAWKVGSRWNQVNFAMARPVSTMS